MRKPRQTDGSKVWSLINNCQPLDTNSMYCNLLQTGHFKDTCVISERDGQVVGWVSAYRKPEEPSCLFVWQVAVAPQARGCGLAAQMLSELVCREEHSDIHAIQTTITESNQASWGCFRQFCERTNSELTTSSFLCKNQHFDGKHPSETLVTIRLNPLSPATH